MYFEILGSISEIEVIARGRGIRNRDQLCKKYGGRVWRKLKGNAQVRLSHGGERMAEIHWYEANGIGKKEFKIKKFLD